MKKIIINPSYGGTDTGIISGNFIEKDFNLKLAQEIQKQLNNLNISSNLVRTRDISLTNQERINIINNLITTNDESILITLENIDTSDSGSQIIYSLKNNDLFSRNLSDNLEKIGITINKFYQQRDPNNTNEDYYELIKSPNTKENIIISLGNPNNTINRTFLLNNISKIATSIANSINTYLSNKNIYIIQSGDTLFSIANKFNLTVDELKKANNLVNNALIVGNTLIIPETIELDNDLTGQDEEMKMFINYTVTSGDTLYKIANKYETTTDILKDINNLENNNLAIGQILKIPNSTTSIDTNYDNYTVIGGDSLYSIAKKFDTTINEIKLLNNLISNNLAIGQVLKIPNIKGENTSKENYSTYTVKKGDSLYSIASKYQTSVNEIKNLNNLATNTLSINQVLKIPANNISNNNKNYTVVSGDSLYSIARKFNTSVNEIKNLNNLISNNLAIGQILKIPN